MSELKLLKLPDTSPKRPWKTRPGATASTAKQDSQVGQETENAERGSRPDGVEKDDSVGEFLGVVDVEDDEP